jgi:tetratricopeptide (TPR) repeat protein
MGDRMSKCINLYGFSWRTLSFAAIWAKSRVKKRAKNVNKALSVTIAAVCVGLIGCASSPPEDMPGGLRQTTTDQANAPIPGYEPPESLEEALRRGDTARQSGNVELAILEYTQGLELSEDPSPLYKRLAVVNYELGNATPAAYAARKTLEFSPDNAIAHQILGNLYLNQKRYQEARSHFEIALKSTEPFVIEGKPIPTLDNPEIRNESLYARFSALTGLGVLDDLDRNFDAAEQNHLAAIKLQPRSALALNNHGYSLYLRARYKQALQRYQSAIQIDPRFELAWRNIGLLLLKQDKLSESEDAFLQVLEPHEAYNDLGYLLMLNGRFDDARLYFEKSIDSVNYYYEPAYKNLEVLQRKESRK